MSLPQPKTPHIRDNDRPYDVVPLTPADESSVAAELRQVRCERGLEMDRVSTDLRIRGAHLSALEEGRVDDLPGPTYVVGFLRSYAEYLGLDGDEMVRRFKEEESGFAANQSLHFPTPSPEGRIPGLPLILSAMALAAVAYFGWHYLAAPEKVAHDLVPPVPQDLTTAATDEPAPSDSDAVRADGTELRAQAPQIAATESRPDVRPELRPDKRRPVQTLERLFGPEESVDARDNVAASETPAAMDSAEPDVTRPIASETDTVDDTSISNPVDAVPPGSRATPRSSAQDAAESVAPPVMRAATPVESQETAGEYQPATAQSLAELSGPMTSPTAAPQQLASEADTEISTADFLPTEIASAPAEPTRAPRVFGERQPDTRIRLLATKESWVQVTDRNGQLLLTRILRPGDMYFVPNRPGLEMMTGNAGGLEISVDGKALPALGPLGTVRRGIALEAEKLLSRADTP